MNHVYPVNDAIPHNLENGGQCDCRPKLDVLENGDILIIHNSWDGREIFEQLDDPQPPAPESEA